MNTKNQKIAINQTSINFEEALKLRKLQNKTGTKTKISDVLEDKNVPELYDVNIVFKNFNIYSIEYINGKIRKIFVSKLHEKYQINITGYELESIKSFSSSKDDESETNILKNLEIPSYNVFPSGRLIKNYHKNFKDIAEYIIKYYGNIDEEKKVA